MDCLDIVTCIVEYIDPSALIAVLLTSRCCRNAVLRLSAALPFQSNVEHYCKSLAAITWIVEDMKCKSSMIGKHAAVSGSMEGLLWLKDRGLLAFDTELAMQAVHSGKLPIVKWLREENNPPCPWDTTVTAAAACIGRIDILAYCMRSPGACPVDDEACAFAAGNGHLHVLTWIQHQGILSDPWSTNVCAYAAEAGHLDVLKWLRKERVPPSPWDEDTCAYAAFGGHLHVLKWLRWEIYPACPWNEATCYNAAEAGHLEVLQWLRQCNGLTPCPWGLNTFAYASLNGHLHVMEWLKNGTDQSCPWNELSCRYACRSGRLNVLKWLRENNNPPCPWSEECCIEAASMGHLHILKYLRACSPPCPWSLRNTLCAAFDSGQREVCKWLQEDNLLEVVPLLF